MTESEIAAFKRELKNYRHYERHLKAQRELLEVVYRGISGPYSPKSGEVHSTNPDIKKEHLHRAYEEIDRIHRQIDKDKRHLKEMDDVLESLPKESKKLIFDAVIDGSYQSASAKYHYSPGYIHKLIIKALKKSS